MIAHNQIEGGWTELKGKVKEVWGQIDDDELRQFEGDVDQLIGMIQRKTGEARAEIEQRLREVDEQFRPMLQQAADTARQYIEQGSQAASQAADRVRESIAAGHTEAEEVVRRHPMESVAVAFGTGIVAGVVLGLVCRSR